VGSVRVGCSTNAAGKAQFTISATSQTFLGAVNPALWVGCRPAPPGCTPPRYGELKNTNFTSTGPILCGSGCGGPFPGLLTAPTTNIALACPCASVSFVIHESSRAFVAVNSVRVRAANNGTCPAPSDIGKVGV
jgi:hypothetical protein